MTKEEWTACAVAHAVAGIPLIVTPDQYAELVRLRMCSDPGNPLHHDEHLLGVPLEVR